MFPPQRIQNASKIQQEIILWNNTFKKINQSINQWTDKAGSMCTSSGVSLVSGWPWIARRARAPALMLLRLICRSGGGPPRGWPRTMTAQPDNTCQEKNKTLSVCLFAFTPCQIFSWWETISTFYKSLNYIMLLFVNVYLSKTLFVNSFMI